METSELLKRVRKIEIKTRGLSNQIFSGEYHSAFKGRGMAFSEVREYMPGDPIRSIDWNVTARLNHPYVKVFEEEREITMMLIVDVSASENFGSKSMLKREMITEVAAVLAFSAVQNNDKIGIIFFSDRIEKYIPPKKGKSHILRIIRELIDFEPEGTGTNIKEALGFFNNVTKKRSIAFLISDMLDSDYEKPLRIAKRKHDFVTLLTKDIAEETLPDLGLVPMKDFESGKTFWVDTSDKEVRKNYKRNRDQKLKETEDLLRKSGIDYAHLYTNRSYVQPLMQLFKKRESKR
ncbi:DUF58 domain-containing protein [Salibacteraceae bacterium]|nr:DUF58 domain-containing protein [Salibacteraceae bacterium]MDB4105298.1 DUF58 domain-containing protein [Salibacteraceae bacterium]MDB9708954.1 DUF58 domain-containing protein [Salibacteraceae bacterium]